MKLFLQYLRRRRRFFIVGVVFCFIFAVSFLLYHLPIGAVIYPTLLCSALGILIMVFDFLRVKREHEALSSILSMTDVIAGLFPKIDGIKDEDYQQIFRLISEEHNDHRWHNQRFMLGYFRSECYDEKPYARKSHVRFCEGLVS